MKRKVLPSVDNIAYSLHVAHVPYKWYIFLAHGFNNAKGHTTINLLNSQGYIEFNYY